MNYQAIYNSLIERGKHRTLEGYSEKHHIIPRCMGGNNDSENLVKLTAREHFIAHRLLAKIYPESEKLWHAFRGMCFRKGPNRKYKISSRLCEILKTSKRFKRVCVFCHNEYFAGSSTGKACLECRKPRPCKCGCGELVVSWGKFHKKGHRPKKKNYERVCTACNTTYQTESSKSKFCSECRKPKPCKCGCSQMVVYPGRYFKASHDKSINNEHKCTCRFCGIKYIAGSAVGKTCVECSKPRLCKCGCGAIIKKPGAYFRTKAHKVYFEDKFDK